MMGRMRRASFTPTIRPRRRGDDPLLLALGAEAFARWSHHPAATIARMLGAKDARVTVAESEDAPIAFAVVDVRPLGRAYGPWPSPSIAHLDAICVKPDARGTGVGTVLLSAAEDDAREHGAVVLRLMTATENVRARQLFNTAGFQPLYTAGHAYANGDAAIEMFKLLG